MKDKSKNVVLNFEGEKHPLYYEQGEQPPITDKDIKPSVIHHSHNLPRCSKCGLITLVKSNTKTSCNCGAEIRG